MWKYVRNQRRPDVILFNYNVIYEDEGEYLSGYMGKKKRLVMMPKLVKYYRHHNEVPRWFIKGIVRIMRKYHDRQRKIMYSRLNGKKRIDTCIIYTEQNEG